MKKKSTTQLYSWRFYFLLGLMGLGFLGLLARIFYLQVLEKDFLRTQGDARTMRVVNIPAYRGVITDRNGDPLAVTTPVNAIWINPKVVDNNQDFKTLAKLLDLSVNYIKKIANEDDKTFVYLKRQVPPEISEQVDELAIEGVYSKREYRRYYPAGEITAHVVGFTDVDDRGQEGLELAYNDWLAGRDGSKKVLKDRLGRVIDDLGLVQQPIKGNDLILSIDRRLQYLAYRELKAVVDSHDAVSGSIVILDVNNGEVLAMVNQPGFNPNNRRGIQSYRVRNRAVTDVFEPGSVIKAFSIATALQSGEFLPQTVIDTNPGWMQVDGRTVRDIRNYGRLDLTGILKKSSNVGISKIILGMAPNTFTEHLFDFGFGQTTGSGFPGERDGNIVVPLTSDVFSQSTLGFGYGLSVTSLQLARAYAVLGSGGIKRPVSFIKLEPDQVPEGERVLSEKTARTVLDMLQSVISAGGSGRRAQIPGYQVTGKTGTSRKVGKHGYEENKHRAVFSGLIPASKPQLVMVVMIDEPRQGGYYGGLIAAPVFAKVMAGAVRLLNITPDDTDAVQYAGL